MKVLLLCIHVDVKSLTSEILRCHLADYVKKLYLCAIILPHSTDQVTLFWRCHYHVIAVLFA